MDSNNRILCALGSSGDVKRINTDGTFDNTFNYNLFTSLGLYGGSWINCIVEKDGFYYAAGEGSPNHFISKINQTGSLDPAFSNYLQTDSNVEDMIVNNNNIIIRGSGYIVKYLLNTTTLSTTDAIKTSLDIVFENPVKQNLVYSAKEKISKMEIYSPDGKLVKTIKENNSNVSELSKGVYFAKVTFDNGKSITKKIIKL
ncbi:T9SS type A sorting domain-containing protein [Chryseobacterium arachidis]|uniref:T9SS type A sorting domain-containing protein n=1 Tax=Chryseobacterium arachidis TaxID=1416778 RepID=UPI003620B4F8